MSSILYIFQIAFNTYNFFVIDYLDTASTIFIFLYTYIV